MSRSYLVLSAIVAAGVSVGTQLVINGRTALADGNPATDNVAQTVAYTGRLELDGVAYNGNVGMRFSIFDGASSSTPIWTEDWFEPSQVTVYAGDFSVQLGSRAAGLAAVIARADDLYLAISIGESADTLVPLGGRQRFTPVPYAMWSARGADFDVARDLRVARNANVVGTLTTSGSTTLSGPTAVNSTLAVSGTTTAAAINASGAVTSAGLLSANGGLSVNGGSTLRGGTTVVGGLQTDATATTIGGFLTLGSTDLIFGEVAGRGGGRALVNRGSDILSINHDGDFAGGVDIAGPRVNVPGGLTAGDLTVGDQFSLANCSLCLYWSDTNDAGTRRYTCTSVLPGASSPPLNLAGTINSDDRLRLAFRCDGTGSISGDW